MECEPRVDLDKYGPNDDGKAHILDQTTPAQPIQIPSNSIWAKEIRARMEDW